MEKKLVQYNVKLHEETTARVKKQVGAMNVSRFIRDAIEEKLKRVEKNS